MDLNTYSFITVPLAGHENPIAVDYDYVNARIYWTDVAADEIRSASLDGTDNETVRALGDGECTRVRIIGEWYAWCELTSRS